MDEMDGEVLVGVEDIESTVAWALGHSTYEGAIAFQSSPEGQGEGVGAIPSHHIVDFGNDLAIQLPGAP